MSNSVPSVAYNYQKLNLTYNFLETIKTFVFLYLPNLWGKVIVLLNCFLFLKWYILVLLNCVFSLRLLLLLHCMSLEDHNVVGVASPSCLCQIDWLVPRNLKLSEIILHSLNQRSNMHHCLHLSSFVSNLVEINKCYEYLH